MAANRGSFEGAKGTNIAHNSSDSLKQSGGIIKNQKQIVLDALADGTAKTSRELTTITQIERASVTKALNVLVAEKKIKIAFDATCNKTGRRCGHYALIEVDVKHSPIEIKKYTGFVCKEDELELLGDDLLL